MGKIQRKYSISAKGTLDITDGVVSLENEDTGELINLTELFDGFQDKEVSLSLQFSEEY